jgi:predicted metal-dependent phosphoesterase TrpH
MQLVNGVELSCTWGGATIHVLGYGFDVNAAPLVEAIAKLHDGRWLRSEEISRKLALKGMPGALEGAREIQQELGDSGNAPARPHFADWMVREGFVKDRAEAFRKWLGAGKLGDVKQHWPTLEETVETLRAAKAWVSLAHPWHYEFTRSKRRRLIADYIQAGRPRDRSGQWLPARRSSGQPGHSGPRVRSAGQRRQRFPWPWRVVRNR